MPKKEKSNKKIKQDTKYNAENEIIIGVTTKPKEKVRVEKKKATRTNIKTSHNKNRRASNKNVSSKNQKRINTKKQNVRNKFNEDTTKEKQIKKLNIKKIIISIVILLLISIGGTIYYLTTPVFNVSSIMVYGNEKNSTDTYISLSGIKINETNIFAFTTNNIVDKIKENPYVSEVKIERKLPNVVELHITERKVDYQISHMNSYVYLDNQGYILEISEEMKEVPAIEGILSTEENIEVGQRVANKELVKLDTVLKIVNYIKYNSIETKLTSIDVSNTSNYILEFAEEEKKAYIGDSSSITEKMTAVAKILEIEKKNKGIIHATEEELKRNRVYFSELKGD